jgi:beta-lactamase regulating signal transducer with metallopeptidase domain
MNELGELFLRAMLQVTVLVLAAAGLYGWAARRGPEIAARVASLALALCLVLTFLALCPLPSWWGWKGSALPTVSPASEPPSSPEPAAAAARESVAGADGAATGWSAGDLWRACKGMLPQGPAVNQSRGGWQAVVAVLGLAGAGLGLLRLLLGLGAAHFCRRRGRAIEDGGLREEVDALRAALGCRRAIELRESADLQTPATIGWLWPVVLLPAGWRGWSAAERRAALAHELAHVGRSDYLGALVARLSAALHFYHPVVYWLAGRLRLQQELAADASAARVVGGRGCYLLALARLALRQDGRPPRWPAASFLFSHGTLLKRIAMLRAKERSEGRRRPRLAHLFTAALLLAAGLLASSLRGPQLTAAPEDGAEKPASASAISTAPFDLSYIPPDARGVVALRPAAFFGQPGMQKYARLLNGVIAAQLLALGKESPGLGVADIEQVVFPLTLHYNPKAPKGQRRGMIFGPGAMIRSARDFDWHKQLGTWLPGLAEAHHGGVTYYRIPKAFPAFGLYGCLLFPDARTVVGMQEKDLHRMIDHGKDWKKAHAWGDHWKDVEHDLAAVTFRTENLLSEKEEDDPTEIALVRASERLTAGVESCATPKVRLWLQCRDAQGSEKWEQYLRTQIKELAAESKEAAPAQKEKTPQEKAFESLEEELFSGLHFTRQGAQLMLRTESRRSYAELAGLLVPPIDLDKLQAESKRAAR